VTAGSGWYPHNDRMPVQVRLFWFVAIPLLTPSSATSPQALAHGRRLRPAWPGSAPLGHAPEYLLTKGGDAPPVRRGDPRCGLLLRDDAIITKPAIDEMHRSTATPSSSGGTGAADAGRGRIGHFGYFLPESRGNLWRDTLAWLRAKAAA